MTDTQAQEAINQANQVSRDELESMIRIAYIVLGMPRCKTREKALRGLEQDLGAITKKLEFWKETPDG